MARTATATLRSGDLAAAETQIEALRTALASAPPASATPPADPAADAANFAKYSAIWRATQTKLKSEIDKLAAAIIATYQPDGIAGDLEKAYRDKVAPILTRLDGTLADKLDQATKAPDASARAALVAEAQSLLNSHSQYVASEALIGELDSNPFVPLAIRATLGGTLSALSKSVN